MRYALFFTPPVCHSLTETAAKWLGRNAYTGAHYDQQNYGTLTADRISELTAAPRRYGFHATLKAPFYLSQNCNENQLVTAIEQFCEYRTAFTMPRLKVGRIGPFFALVPVGKTDELNRFAADTVRYFEPYRAPISDADYARRNPDKLEEQQRLNLQKWGYPYIFDAFRFHMTLTGHVPNDESDHMEDILRSQFDSHLLAPLICDHLTLFTESEKAGPFTIHCSVPFAASPTKKATHL